MTHDVRLLGLEFADLDAEAAAVLLARRNATEPFGYVTTPNADHLVRLHRQRDLLPLYQNALLRLLDSRVVASAARLSGLAAPHVAPGSDLTALLLTRHLAAGEAVTIIGLAARWVPQLMARHRDNPSCFACHQMIDPLGFALEGFDAVGAWRTHEAGAPVDASARLADGRAVNGVNELRSALAARPDAFVQTLTEKLMIYALGRGLQYYDIPVVRAIVRDSKAKNYSFDSVLLGIVRSAPFQMRAAPNREN